MKAPLRVAMFLFAFSSLRAAEPLDQIAFSSFGKLDAGKVAQLQSGEIFTAANTSMKFPRGLSSQACYVVPAAPAAVAHLLQNEDPTARPELEVYQYHAFYDGADGRFETLKFDPAIDPVRKLTNAMARGGDLQLSKAELVTAKAASRDPKTAAAFWANLLKLRCEAIRRGGAAALPACEAGGNSLSAISELKKALAEEPVLAKRFAPFLNQTALMQAAPALPQMFYWSLSNVNKVGNLNLGVFYAQEQPDHWQLLYANLYVSSGYVTSLTLYELWPIEVNGKAHTLVWQADLVSATELAGGFGIKRKIASLLIQNDLKTSAHALQQDAAKAR